MNQLMPQGFVVRVNLELNCHPFKQIFSAYQDLDCCHVVENLLLVQVSLFPALLVIDAKRQAVARYDFFPFIVRSSSKPLTQWFKIWDGGIDEVMKHIGELLELSWVKAALIMFFITLAGFGFWGLSGLTVSSKYFHILLTLNSSFCL